MKIYISTASYLKYMIIIWEIGLWTTHTHGLEHTIQSSIPQITPWATPLASLNVCAGSEWKLLEKSDRSIYPVAVGLDCNFRQDVWIRHFHGYRIGALCPPVSVKLENVWFVGWQIVLLCMVKGSGGRHRVTRALERVLFWRSGNRYKTMF